MDTTGKYVEDQDAEDNLQGTTNATITLASLKDSALELENQKGIVYSHAEVDGDVATEAQILPAGDLVIKLYYNRLQYTVTLTNGTPNGITALIGADTYYYGESVTISATLKEDSGYTWHKWTSDNVNGMPSKIQSFTFTMPARGVSATGYAAIPVPDLIEVYPNEPDKITIVSYKGTEPNIVIPDKIDKNEDNMAITGVTYTVIAIAPNAFNGNSSLQSVSIPATVVTIGRYAFANCDSLTTIEIQATNVEIGENAFGLNTKDTNFSKKVYINDKNVAKTIVKSSLYANPNLGLSDYGNLLVDVNTVFVASSITELSDFLISSFEKDTTTVTYRDVDYNVYRRRTNATATTFRREDDIEDEDITIEPDATL